MRQTIEPRGGEKLSDVPGSSLLILLESYLGPSAIIAPQLTLSREAPPGMRDNCWLRHTAAMNEQ
jgi:hypothetical protein